MKKTNRMKTPQEIHLIFDNDILHPVIVFCVIETFKSE